MTYQARAALQVLLCAPSFRSQIRWTRERERRGIRTAFLLLLGLRGEMRSVLKPHARIRLPHLRTRGFSLKPERKFYSKTALTDPVTSLRSSRSTQEQNPSVKSAVPSSGCWPSSSPSKAPGTATVGKEKFIPCLARYQFIAALAVDTGPHPPPHGLSLRSSQHGLRARLSGPQVGAWRVADRFLQTADVEALQRRRAYGLELAERWLCWTTRPAPRSGESRCWVTVLLRRAHRLGEGA